MYALSSCTVGWPMPLTSCECRSAESVALVAVEVAAASEASSRRSSRPLPAHASAYERWAAWLLMVSKIVFINLRSIASINSGAKMNRFDSPEVSGARGEGKLRTGCVEAVVLVAAGAAPACRLGTCGRRGCRSCRRSVGGGERWNARRGIVVCVVLDETGTAMNGMIHLIGSDFALRRENIPEFNERGEVSVLRGYPCCEVIEPRAHVELKLVPGWRRHLPIASRVANYEAVSFAQQSDRRGATAGRD
eukprot:6173491-Pleurochrysis_carterae.AAC.2